MSITGYIPTLEASFTFTDNSGTATQWGYQLVGYLQKNGTTNKFRYPQGRIDASTLTNGSTQTVRFPGITPGTSYDGFVALVDLRGNETPQVALFTNYAVPKVASGSPVGPIWGKLHHLPITTDPTNGTWNPTNNAFDPSVHDPVVVLGSVTGLNKNLVADSDIAFGFNGYWTNNGLTGITRTPGVGGGDAGLYYTGTGAASGFLYAYGVTRNLTASQQYNFSGYCHSSAISSGTVTWYVMDGPRTTVYATLSFGPSSSGRQNVAFTVPTSGTYVVVADTNDATVTNGQAVIWSEPMIQAGSSATGYQSGVPDASGQWPYGIHHPVFRALVNSDGTAGKTTDWLPEGTNKYAAEHGADITGNHTAADTSKVNGVASSSISPIATLMPAEAGADVTANHNAAGTGSGGNARTAANLAAIVGTDNAIPSSAPLKTHVPNSIANLTSNIAVQFYSATSGSLVAWITSNIATSKSPGGTNYPDWEYPDGSGGIFPGSVNGYSTVNGTSQSAQAKYWNGSSAVSMSWSGLGTSGVYILIGYNPALDYYTIPYGPNATAPTDDVVAAAQGDGSVLVALVSASSGTIIHTAGGGGQPIGGGGGRPRE